MKRILFILLCLTFCGTNKSHAQVSVVSAPALETMTSTNLAMTEGMMVSIQSMEQADRLLTELQKKTDWLRRMESVQEFIEIFTTTACMIRDLAQSLDAAIRLGLLDPYQNCFNMFVFRMNTNRIRQAQDVLNTLLTSGHQMSAGQRIATIMQAMDYYRMSQQSLYGVKVQVESLVRSYERMQDVNKTAYDQYFRALGYTN